MQAQTTTVAAALLTFQQDRQREIENWTREYAREVRIVHELCNWYRLKYGLLLTFDDLTLDLMRRYRSYRQQFDTPSAFNRRRTGLHVFCEWAIACGYLHNNPVSRVPVMKRKSTQRMRNG